MYTILFHYTILCIVYSKVLSIVINIIIKQRYIATTVFYLPIVTAYILLDIPYISGKISENLIETFKSKGILSEVILSFIKGGISFQWI